MADPLSDNRDGNVDDPRKADPARAFEDDRDADASRPVSPVLLLVVGGLMATLVVGLVWSTGHGLRWW